jgi:hypothetical protein
LGKFLVIRHVIAAIGGMGGDQSMILQGMVSDLLNS